MKINFSFVHLVLFGLSTILATNCSKKSDPSPQTNVNSPTLSTVVVSNIGATTSESGGNITSDGGATVTARGVCYSTHSNPTISDNVTSNGNGPGSFTSTVSGLTPLTAYHVRAYATNSAGTAYGNDISFSTNAPAAPSLTTTDAGTISTSSAKSGGTITDNGGAPVTARGVCYGTSHNPDISGSTTSDGTGNGSFISSLTGLTPLTTYYVRAYATNSIGTSYGAEISFYSAITDIDGNVYTSVIIGTQEWLVENLKVTKYRDGSLITHTTDPTTWQNYYNTLTGAWRDYSDLTSNDATYGKLYNWYAVSDSRNIAPTGWHVASDAEWTTLETYLGSSAGGILKSTSTWASPNTGATNSVGFNSLAGGFCDPNGDFYNQGLTATYWTTLGGTYHYQSNTTDMAISYTCIRSQGMSVRCVRD
jgi:uncharacterized protein (TIGR02145 family)